MKLELKTESEKYTKSFSYFFGIVFIIAFIIVIFDVAFKLRIISKNFEIDYNCRVLSVDKSTTNFKKLATLSNLKSKQQIWEFCREIVK